MVRSATYILLERQHTVVPLFFSFLTLLRRVIVFMDLSLSELQVPDVNTLHDNVVLPVLECPLLLVLCKVVSVDSTLYQVWVAFDLVLGEDGAVVVHVLLLGEVGVLRSQVF